MKIKRLFAVILAACMAFSAGLIGSSAEDAAPNIEISADPDYIYANQWIGYTFNNLTSDMELGIVTDAGGQPAKSVKKYIKNIEFNVKSKY